VDPNALARARELAGYTQDDIAAALGVARPMVSYWETGTRKPSERQLSALTRLYGRSLGALLQGDSPDEPAGDGTDIAAMLYRKVPGAAVSPETLQGLGDFASFLNTYADLLRASNIDHRPMRESPFLLGSGFDSPDDARRKAEEVRAHLRLGLGPIVDVYDLCELLGITVYRTALGQDLSTSVSGAFFRHPEIGFAIVVNLQMTRGRRRFTLAHELGHALLHSNNRESAVVSGPRKDPRERFADTFAGEFLMPTEGIRRALEEMGVGRSTDDPADVVHLQRYFNVSWITALVRLRQAKVITEASFEEWQDIRPVAFAEALGYETSKDDYGDHGDLAEWGLSRFPRSFVRILRQAVRQGIVSTETAAERARVSVEEIERLADDADRLAGGEHQRELSEFSAILK
jgi:Zn-dependent peptidase ImmA (M78 family)/transcriptional regulator with XRE-family HTH domain